MKRLRVAPRVRQTLGSGALALLVSLPAGAGDAGAPDAGASPWLDPVYAVCPEAPPPEPLDGGAWLLSAVRGSRNACLMATCAERVRELEGAPPAPAFSAGSMAMAGVLAGLALVLGLYVGVTVSRYLPR